MNHHPSCPQRGHVSRYTGHALACTAYVTVDESDCDCACICPSHEETADLVETDEEVPVEVDGPEYEYACIGSIVCEPLTDYHGRECERVNQEARVDFYEEVAASRFGATAWTGVGR